MLAHRDLPNKPFHRWRHASFALISDRSLYQSGEEEVSAERVTLEANLQQTFREREFLLRNELVELHFANYMSQQVRQELQTWEAQQRELYETRFRTLEYELHPHFAQTQLDQQTLFVRYFRDLQGELQEVEEAYRETVQQEARTFAQGLHQELNDHMTSNAQGQSLLSA